jgi:hypothetical protein
MKDLRTIKGTSIKPEQILSDKQIESFVHKAVNLFIRPEYAPDQEESEQIVWRYLKRSFPAIADVIQIVASMNYNSGYDFGQVTKSFPNSRVVSCIKKEVATFLNEEALA